MPARDGKGKCTVRQYLCPGLTRHGVAGLVLEDVGEVLDVELRGVAVEFDPGRVLAREDADAERKLLVLN